MRRDRIDPPAERLIGSETVQLLGVDASMPPCFAGDCSPLTAPVKPVYAQRFALPGVENGASAVTTEGDRVRVTFTPLAEGTRFWAVVSATTSDNLATVYSLPW